MTGKQESIYSEIKQEKLTGRISMLCLFTSIMMLCIASAFSMPVYLADDRKDIWEINDPQILTLADSSVAVIQSWKTLPDRGRMLIRANSFGEEVRLCDGEPFADQKIAADCSGALVGPDLVLTAAHCIASPITCRQHLFVFGFAITKEGGLTPVSIPSSEVYYCRELIDAHYHGENMTDWAVVRLDRPVSNHRPLEMERGAVSLNAPVMVIGYPNGLPAKFADNARVIDNTADEYFKANLDTFGGNSGSPVFHAATGKIVGVLSRGEKDFEKVIMPDGSECKKTKQCLNGDCAGEDVTRVSEFGHLIPEISRD